MKLLRILVLLILAAAGGALFLYWKTGGKIVTENSFIQETLKIDNTQIEDFAKNTSEELGSLTERSKVVGEHAQNVLGSSVEVSGEQPAIHERALEYGRYVYCQEVVKEYEAKDEDNSSQIQSTQESTN